MEEKFEWSGSLSAPKEYPVEVYEGHLISIDYDQNFKDWGTINSGWGNLGGTVVSGPRQKAAPDSLNITWLSFAEDKFYSGSFALPKDKITALLKTGFTDADNTKRSFTDVVTGLAPGGTVVIWVLGPGRKVQVAQFKAREIRIDPKTVASHDSYMFREGYAERTMDNDMVITDAIKSKIAESGTPEPSDYGDRYQRKYSWKPGFELYENGKPVNFAFEMLNGEMDLLSGQTLQDTDFLKRAVPKNCSFYWKTDKGVEHGIKITAFDEKEIMAAFESIGDKSATLLFKIAPENKLSISLKSDSKEVVLKKGKVQSF